MMPDDKNTDDRRFEAFLRGLPEDQTLSDEVAVRLAHARAKALASQGRRSVGTWFGSIPRAAAGILIVLGMSLLLLDNGSESLPQQPAGLIAEMDNLPDQADMELIDDLDFYLWYSELEAG